MEEDEKQPHPPNGIVRAVPIPSLRGGGESVLIKEEAGLPYP
jgi:hypothetical protein